MFFSRILKKEERCMTIYILLALLWEREVSVQKFCRFIERRSHQERYSSAFVDSTEAEAIKLFSNTYLALRVAYFNELDSYAQVHHLDSKQIIEG